MTVVRDRTRRPDRRTGTRYSAALREAALGAIDEGLGAGRSLTSLAAEMRLPLHTIRRWLARRRTVFRPVEITTGPAASPATGFVVQTARGHRLEGLDLPALLAVLRVLESAA